MYAAFRGELFKFVRRPGIWVLVILLLVLAVVIGYAVTYLVDTFGSSAGSQGLPAGTTMADFKVALYPENFVKGTLGTWGALGGVFALIMGVLVQGSEFGWGTTKTLYTQRYGRLTMLFGKILALSVLVLVMVVGLLAVDAASSSVIALIDGKAIATCGRKDPEASDGYKSYEEPDAKGQLRKIVQHWFGYKLHLDVADGQIPISCVLTSASLHDSQVAVPLAELTAQRVTSLYDLMDRGYESDLIGEHSRRLGHVPIIDAQARGEHSVPMAPHQALRFRERTTVERVYSRLKQNFGGETVRVRGWAKVMAHLMFGILALTADQILRLSPPS